MNSFICSFATLAVKRASRKQQYYDDWAVVMYSDYYVMEMY